MSLGRDPAEAGKRLSAGLLAGDSPLAMDNVEVPLGDDDLLCQAITQPWLAIRPLGASVQVRVPARTALLTTGNNLVVRGDLVRRVMLIRLDAQMERPETRVYEGDILAEVAARRAELVRAALVAMLAYQAAGCPYVAVPPLGGFQAWDRLVRRAVVWAGLDDPLGPVADVRDDDPDRAAMRALYAAWAAIYGDRVVTAAQVVDDATRGAPRYDGTGHAPDHPDLHDAVAQVCGARVDARRLGYALRRYRGRIVDGMRLEQAGAIGRAKVVGWRLART